MPLTSLVCREVSPQPDEIQRAARPLRHPPPPLECNSVKPGYRPPGPRSKFASCRLRAPRAIDQQFIGLLVGAEDEISQRQTEETCDVQVALVVGVMGLMKAVHGAPDPAEHAVVQPAFPPRVVGLMVQDVERLIEKVGRWQSRCSLRSESGVSGTRRPLARRTGEERSFWCVRWLAHRVRRNLTVSVCSR